MSIFVWSFLLRCLLILKSNSSEIGALMWFSREAGPCSHDFSVPSYGRCQCCWAISRPLWQGDPPLWGVPADGFISTSLGSAAPLTISTDFTHNFSFIVMCTVCCGLSTKSSRLNVSKCHIIIWIANASQSWSSAGLAAGSTCWQAKNFAIFKWNIWLKWGKQHWYRSVLPPRG